MRILFYDGNLLDFLFENQKHFNLQNTPFIDARQGPKACYEKLRKLSSDKNPPKSVLTNSLTALTHVFGWNEAEHHTDIYIWCEHHADFVRCDFLTKKEIREAHNIEKIYMSYGFEDHSVRVGNPIYQSGDYVSFKLGTEKLTGQVAIVDSHGTFEQNIEPSYDILVNDYLGTGDECLVKHVRESTIIPFSPAETK